MGILLSTRVPIWNSMASLDSYSSPYTYFSKSEKEISDIYEKIIPLHHAEETIKMFKSYDPHPKYTDRQLNLGKCFSAFISIFDQMRLALEVTDVTPANKTEKFDDMIRNISSEVPLVGDQKHEALQLLMISKKFLDLRELGLCTVEDAKCVFFSADGFQDMKKHIRELEESVKKVTHGMKTLRGTLQYRNSLAKPSSYDGKDASDAGAALAGASSAGAALTGASSAGAALAGASSAGAALTGASSAGAALTGASSAGASAGTTPRMVKTVRTAPGAGAGAGTSSSRLPPFSFGATAEMGADTSSSRLPPFSFGATAEMSMTGATPACSAPAVGKAPAPAPAVGKAPAPAPASSAPAVGRAPAPAPAGSATPSDRTAGSGLDKTLPEMGRTKNTKRAREDMDDDPVCD